MTHIKKETIQFLKDIKDNNNKEWFAKNKNRYVAAKQDVEAFGTSLQIEMEKYDDIEKMKVYRIYRDVRFSKDKTPYKISLAGHLVRATQLKRGGMYFHFEPNGASMVGGGFWNPNSADLARIRQEIAADPSYLRNILNEKAFLNRFGELYGNQVKTAPKGYSRTHPAIDLLRYKQFLLMEKFTDEEITTAGFLDKMVASFRAMRPFFDYMSDVLTTNANGELIV